MQGKKQTSILYKQTSTKEYKGNTFFLPFLLIINVETSDFIRDLRVLQKSARDKGVVLECLSILILMRLATKPRT